jgi:hypothetical protein
MSESTDLASDEPKRVAEMKKLYDAWSAQQAEATVKDAKGSTAPKKKLKQKNSSATKQ